MLDPRGNATTTEYETLAYTFPSKVTKPATDSNRVAHVTQYLNYDYRIGRPRTVVDENSRTTSYSYEGFGRLAQVDYPDGGQTQMGYADQAFPRYEVTSIKEDAANRINKYKYFDGFDRNIQTVTFGEGGKRIASKTYYDVMGRVRHVSGPYFNGSGSPAYPLNEPSSYPYVSKAYDYRGRVTSVTNPDDEYGTTTTSFAYGGFAVTMTDPDGRVKTEYKDHLGRTIQITEDAVSGGLNLNTSYTYNAAGDLLTIRDAANNSTIIAYNSLGQKRSMTDPDRGMRSFAYDLNSNLVTQKDAKGNVFTFDYDELNRIRTKKAVFYAAPTCPNGGAYSTASGKCEQDAITTYTCPLGGAGYGSAETCNANCTNVGSCVQHTHTGPFHCSKYGGYDADHCYTGCSADGLCNDLTCPESLPAMLGADTCPPETDMMPAGYYSKSSYIVGIDNNYICSGDWYALFKYDSVNHWACSLSDAEYYNDATCTAACRQTAACSGPAYSCQAGWTPSGTKCIQDPVIPTTTEPTVTWTYDSDSITNGRGRLYSVTNTKVASTILGYDGMGRKLGEKKTYEDDAAEYATRYAYDLSGKMTGMTYPDSYQVVYAYHPGSDLLASVRGVSDNREHGRFSLYESTGKIGQIDHANGAATRHTFGPRSTRLYGIVTTSAGQDLQNLGYRYTRAADLYQIKDYLGDVTYTYTYDGLHRLKGETNTGSHPANTFDYDAIGNITRKTLGDNSYVYSYAYPQKHAVSSIAVNGGEPNAFSYDANGNMTEGADFTDTSAVGARSVVYNMDNMPGRITYTKGGNTAVTEFLYDGAGLRAKKTGGGSATYYVHPGYEVKNGVVTKYITAADMKIAQIRGAETAYYHRDHLNSSTVMTDETGARLESTEYAPYGTIRSYTGSRSVTDYRYTGKELDMETGLYYYGARYYDPMIGRFITPDPALSLYIPAPNDNRRLPNGGVFNPVTLNPYAYANNNPMKYVDPDGLWTTPVHLGQTINWLKKDDFVRSYLNLGRIERVAAANAAVDNIFGGKSYMPIIGDPGRHFNANSEGMPDSRDVFAKACLEQAIKHQLVANALAKEGKITQAREYTRLADEWLGTGVHSKQDKPAHAQEYMITWIKDIFGISMHSPFNNGNGLPDADDPKKDQPRYENAMKETIQYLKEFIEATKEDFFRDDEVKSSAASE
ncbi:MAG: RHS repeat-associated core domain-containing protein [Syntrophaceae bacterium]|nr:RHS repeat-associated core domain-containing protein [Syntrophaceae bacterium]